MPARDDLRHTAMRKNHPLHHYLPLSFRNKEQVRQFSKPCTRCGKMLHAKHMYGVARLVDDHIAIAAKAHCPDCSNAFPVMCVIDNQKRVRRVLLPYFFFSLYLRSLKMQQGESEPGPKVEATPAAPAPMPVDLVRAEEMVGRYQGNPIPAWIRIEGRELAFDRIAANAKVAANEFLLDGCLVYRAV
jgi:hypothetical protein